MTTVVLLHSSGASSRQWSALAERLQADDFEVHAIDLHGHGRQAPWQGGRTMSVHDEAVLALPVIERAGGAHLIGHSYGGAVAMHLAATRPSLVHSLAVYEPVLFSLLAEHDPDSNAAREAFELAATMRDLVAGGRSEEAAQRFVDYWSCAPVWQHMPLPQQQTMASRMPIVVQHFDALYDEPLPAARLARLAMPVLTLTGGRSAPAALRIGRLLRSLLPAARHETLVDLGHMGPVTHPVLVNERLLRHLGSLAFPSRMQSSTELALSEGPL